MSLRHIQQKTYICCLWYSMIFCSSSSYSSSNSNNSSSSSSSDYCPCVTYNRRLTYVVCGTPWSSVVVVVVEIVLVVIIVTYNRRLTYVVCGTPWSSCSRSGVWFGTNFMEDKYVWSWYSSRKSPISAANCKINKQWKLPISAANFKIKNIENQFQRILK